MVVKSKKNKKTNKTKRLSREVIAPLIRRPNASGSSRLSVPFWAYSLKTDAHRTHTRKLKRHPRK